jgi:HD-like signal output (HDOD) protein
MPRRFSPEELVAGFSKLSSLPEIYFKIKEAVESQHSSIREVAELVLSDPAITARLLKVANSPIYGMSGRIESVARTLSIFGTQLVHDIVLASSLTTTFSGIPLKLMDMHRFWRTSLFCALAARALGKKAGLVDGERLFLVGLLSRIGHLVMYERIPQLGEVALCHAERTRQPLFAVERQLIGCDYAAVGAALLSHWYLPIGVIQMVKDHVEPEQAQSSAIGTAIVHLAAAMAATANSSSGATPPPSFDPYLWEATGLTPENLPEVNTVVQAEFETAVEAFMPTLAKAA